MGVTQFIVSLEDDLNECVGVGELDGVSGGDFGDDLLSDIPCPLPGTSVGDIMPHLGEIT